MPTYLKQTLPLYKHGKLQGMNSIIIPILLTLLYSSRIRLSSQ